MGRDVRPLARPSPAGRADAPARRVVAGERLERPRHAPRAVPRGAPRHAHDDRREPEPARDVRPGPVRSGSDGGGPRAGLLRPLRRALNEPSPRAHPVRNRSGASFAMPGSRPVPFARPRAVDRHVRTSPMPPMDTDRIPTEPTTDHEPPNVTSLTSG